MRYKFQLTFWSFVKFNTIAGLCFGIGFIPFLVLLNKEHVNAEKNPLIDVIFYSSVASPILFAVTGAAFGIIGYPMYKWLTTKVGMVYDGEIYPSE